MKYEKKNFLLSLHKLIPHYFEKLLQKRVGVFSRQVFRFDYLREKFGFPRACHILYIIYIYHVYYVYHRKSGPASLTYRG